MAGAQIAAGATIAENVVVNNCASVDHDCLVGAHAFIGPGAVLCGEVRIGAHSFVGAGAIVLPGTLIGEESLIAAGAVVTRDVPRGGFAGRRT